VPPGVFVAAKHLKSVKFKIKKIIIKPKKINPAIFLSGLKSIFYLVQMPYINFSL
jgi:hypothetical protein